MLREMSTDQYFEWLAFHQEEPFGLPSLDYLFAHFKALFVNANLKKGKRAYKPEKFLVFGNHKKRELNPEEDEEDW